MATLEEIQAEAVRRGLIPPVDAARKDAVRTEAIRRGLISDTPVPPSPDVPVSKPEVQVSAPASPNDPFALDPNITQRGALVPVGVTKSGEIVPAVPQVALDVIRAFTLPGRVISGKSEPTFEETLNFASTFSPAVLRGSGVGLRAAIEAVPSVKSAEAMLRAATDAVEAGVARTTGEPTIAELNSLVRAARFKEQNITATKGDISQGFKQQADEAKFISSAVDKSGEPLRQVRLQQSEEFIAAANNLVDDLGLPTRTGESVKAALSGRKKLLRSEKNKLYQEVADAAPEVTGVPILTDEIIKSVPDAQTIRRLRTLAPNSVKGVEDLLVEFGIETGDAAVKNFIDAGGEITPLTLGNFDTFRIALGQIDRSDTTGAVKVITTRIREALDNEAVLIDDALKATGITDAGVISTLKKARETVRAIKTEFSPESITGRLINVKRDGVTPVIEASKIATELLRPNAPIENLQRTLSSLRKSGKPGVQAIQDLRASVVMDALEAALKAPSRKTSGIETIGGNQFAKFLSKFGDENLDLLFKGNKVALDRLKNLKQTALDITPTAGAVPRGSAPIILDIMRKASRLPGLAAAVDAVTFVVRAGADDRAVARALRSDPKVLNTLVTMKRKYPEIIDRLGILSALNLAEDQEKIRRAPDTQPKNEA